MIIPAILTTNARIAKERIALAHQMGGWLHLDILDNSLYKFESLSLEEVSSLEFGNLLLEVHCMTDDPIKIAQSSLPVERLVFHYETPKREAVYNKLSDQDLDVWYAVDPGTPIRSLELPSDIAGVVVMGVEPGQTGQEFIQATYERIEELKEYHPDIPVTVDGGVSKENIRLLIAHGVDNLVIGSAIFQQHEPVKAYHEYVKLSDPIGGLYDDQATRTHG